MFYIYFLYSESSDKYYVGYTNDPERRLTEHNTKDFNTFTKKYRPWKLIYSFSVSDTRGEAMKVEKFIKKQKSRKLIETIISNKKNITDFHHVFENSSAG